VILDNDQVDVPPPSNRYDVCIAGGGVAGIVLATTLAEHGRRVLLLEAGGLEASDRSQQFYKGDVVARAYIDLDIARLRFLGGTSNHWSGLCRPLDPHDFARHAHIEGSGWPIGIEALQPYLASACEISEVEPVFGERALAQPAGDLKEVIFRYSPPVRFKNKYLSFLQSSDALDVYLNANLTGLEFDRWTGRVTAAAFRRYDANAPIRYAAADRYVLALGGIENARMLLNVAERAPWIAGPPSDLIGRFFMEHPHHVIGHYVVNSTRTSFGQTLHFLGPTLTRLRREEVANCAVWVEPYVDRRAFRGDALDEVRRIICESTVYRCTPPSEAGTLRAMIEQVPNRKSRVRLSNDRDAFGLRRVVLDWHLSPIDKKTMRTVGLEVGKYFAMTNIGRVRLNDWVLARDDVVPGLLEGEQTGAFHHMGTTRMGHSPAGGVVDRDCRMFRVPNLYLAGSSIFPTVGCANPTLTIVQLTLRLADHLLAA
jgi:glycine/D-amino acid oxidase-like deaminating enzyme